MQRSRVRAKIEVNCFLQIVDNRHRIYRNLLRRCACASPRPRRRTPTITLLQTQLAARASCSGELERMILAGRAAPRRQAQRDGARRPPGRLARPGARGLPHARGVRPRAPREEPRRVRAPDPGRGSDEIFDLRAALDEFVGRRLADTIAPAALKEIRAPGRADGAGASRPRTRRATTCSTSIPRPPGRARRQRQADRDLPQAGQGAAPVPPLNLADGGLLPISAREHRADRRGDRLGRRRSGRPRDVRPRDGQQGAHASRTTDAAAPRTRARQRPHGRRRR